MWKTLWKDPVWSAVIAAVVVAIAGAVGTYLLDLWPAIGNFLSTAVDYILSSSLIPNWVLGLLALLILPTVFILVVVVWDSFSPRAEQAPDWRSYTSDSFLGLRWRWQYLSGSISNLHTFCPHCDYQVFPKNASAFMAVDRISFNCDYCHQNLGAFDESYASIESKIERFIQQKIRNGTWNIQSST
jgi:hypothetical protein